MPDDPTTAGGAFGQIDPQVLKRWQTAMALLNTRGPFGMQPGSQMFGGAGGMGGMGAGAAPGYQNLMNQLQAPQQGIDPRIMQLIQYYLQNQGQYPPGSGAGSLGPSNFPGSGGGVNLGIPGFPGR